MSRVPDEEAGLDPHRSRVSQPVRSEQLSFRQEKISARMSGKSLIGISIHWLRLSSDWCSVWTLPGHEAGGIKLTKWSN